MTALSPLRYIFGYSEENEPRYDLVVDEEHVQVRKYHSYSVAKLKIDSDEEDQSRESAYMRLLSYLLGKNSRSEKLAAMAPLFQEDVTARVNALLQLASNYDPAKKSFQVSVILPSHTSVEDAPLPLDTDIKIEKVRPHLTAVLKFSGFCGRRKRERLAKYLSLWMHDLGYSAKSAPRVAKYNPPFTLPFLRRNEIHIDVMKTHSEKKVVR